MGYRINPTVYCTNEKKGNDASAKIDSKTACVRKDNVLAEGYLEVE